MSPILYLAPLHGVTNSVFRNAFYRHFTGVDFAMAPFINSIHSETAYAKGRGNHFKDLLPEDNKKVLLVPQILSNDAPSFIETTQTISDFGYTEVNWNLGCPFPMVTGKKRGSGLLPYPEHIEQFLSEVCPRINIDLSVKVRLGLLDPQEIIRLMPILNSFPLKKVIIHPRIGTQMYAGNVDLDGFAEAAQISSHQVMYNGDIKSAETFGLLQARFPFITEWMIGRWAMYNPFLFSQIKKAAPENNPIKTIKAFHDDLYYEYRNILYGPNHVLDKMKEIWTYLGRSFSHAEKQLKNISHSKTIESYENAVRMLFSEAIWIA